MSGLLVGWLVIGWGVWPLSPHNVPLTSLRDPERGQYLQMVADSFAAGGDVALARRRLAPWSSASLARDLAALQDQLAPEDPARAARLGVLAGALGAEPPEEPAASAGTGRPASLDRTENILILGMDTRPRVENYRTDSVMVVVIDRPSEQVAIVSVPRDLYVTIPGYGQERINAADYLGERNHYPGGGPALVRRVLQEALGIPTQHYVRIRQDGLVRLVDALGGVTVHLDCPLYEQTPDASSPTGRADFTLPAGDVLLDGAKAKKFVTYRYIQSDFGRVRRQQQLIWAIRNRALRGDVLPRLPQLYGALSDTFNSDLSLVEIVRFADLGLRLQAGNVHATVLDREVLQNFITPDGSEVLVLKDRAGLQRKLGQLFAARPLAQAGQPGPTGCPTPPPGFPDLSSTVRTGS